MSIEDNKRIVRAFIETLHEGTFELLADSGTFWVAGSTPFSGTKSKREMIETFKALRDVSDDFLVMKPRSLTAEEDRVSVEAIASLRLKDGRTYSNEYNILCTVRDGKVIAVREYSDTAHMMEIFGGS